MSEELIRSLRDNFPSHFRNRDGDIPDDFLYIPIHDAFLRQQPDSPDSSSPPDPASDIEKALTEVNFDVPHPSLGHNTISGLTGHPGGLQGSDAHRSLVIERLAFYLPFHSYKHSWGIYIFPESIATLCVKFSPLFDAHGISLPERIRFAKLLLYHHESYHHRVECAVSRFESLLASPCYIDAVSPRYNKVFATAQCFEETCANSYAREETIAAFKSCGAKQQLRDAIDDWFSTQAPGYAQAVGTSRRWKSEIRADLYEDYLNASLPTARLVARSLSSPAARAAWSIWDKDDPGFPNLHCPITYVIHKSGELHRCLPEDLRTCLKTSAFKQKLTRLRIARFQKEGGLHEHWVASDGTGRPVPIPRHSCDIPAGTMRAILRQLGCRMSLQQFLAA